MRTYRRCWRIVAGVTLGLSLATGLSTLTWQTGLALVLPLTGLGALYGFLWAPFLPQVRRPAVNGALLGAATGPALVGIFGMLGPSAALLLGALALLHPATIPWLTGRGRNVAPADIRDLVAAAPADQAGRQPRRPAAVVPGRINFGGSAAGVRAALHTASDEALRQAWLSTNDSLGFSRSPERALELAEIRALVLDEFEVRDPEAFRTWLWAAPRPTEGPDLRRRHRHSSDR